MLIRGKCSSEYAALDVSLEVQGETAKIVPRGDSGGRPHGGGANPGEEPRRIHARRPGHQIDTGIGHTASTSVGNSDQYGEVIKYYGTEITQERAGYEHDYPHKTPVRHQEHVKTIKAGEREGGGRKGHLTADEEARLQNILHQNVTCFSAGDRDVGKTDLGAMCIELTTDKPVVHRPYRLSCMERRVVRNKVQELVEGGIVQESDSDYASPIILIPKKGGNWRLCVDYRRLNAITVKDRYPLPLTADQLDRLASKKYFTTLDLAQGYHQVPMHPNYVHKTAFITPDGQYEYLRVPFGLANAPAVFQRIVNKMLGNL